jgi:hypothetical protein
LLSVAVVDEAGDFGNVVAMPKLQSIDQSRGKTL